MASYNLTVTNGGESALASATAHGWTLNITSAQFGSGVIGAGNPKTQTSLITPQVSVDINNSNTLVSQQASVEFSLSTDQVSTSFAMAELGLWASLNGGTPILFVYGYSLTPDTITPTSSTSAENYDFQFGIKYSQATHVTVSLSNTVSVPLHANTHILGDSGINGGIDPLPTAGALPGLVPASPNDPRQVLCGTQPVSFIQLPAGGSPLLTNGDLSFQNRAGSIGHSVSSNGGYLLDNWNINIGGSGGTLGSGLNSSWNSWDGLFTPDSVFRNPPGFVRITRTGSVSPSSSNFLDLQTFVEAGDLLEATTGPVCFSALLRSSSPVNILAYLTSGDGTRYYGHTFSVGTSWSRLNFAVSSWPSYTSHFNGNNPNQLGLTLSFRLLNGSAATVPASNDTWTTSTTTTSSYNPWGTNGAYFDIAGDVRADINATSIASPIFEPQPALAVRCLRLFEYMTFSGDVYSPGDALGDGTFSVYKRVYGGAVNITPSTGAGGNGTIQISNGNIANVTGFVAVAPWGFNQLTFSSGAGGNVGYGCWCQCAVDASF